MSDRKTEAHAALPEELHQIKEFWEANGQRILTVICIVLAVTLGIRFYRSRTVQAQEEATAAFGMPASVEQAQSIADEYAGTHIEALSRLNLAMALYDDGRFDDARLLYQDLAQALPNHEIIAPSAILGEAHALEAVQRTEEALKIFSAFTERETPAFVTPMAFLGKARCEFALDRLDDALTTLELFANTREEDDYWKQRADRLGEILKRRAGAPGLKSQPEDAVPPNAPVEATVLEPTTNAPAL